MANQRLAFQTQLASIMEVLANAAVAEICKLVDDDYAVVSLQMSQCQRENKALKRKNNLLELKMARGYAERRLRESALNAAAGGHHQRPRVSLHVSAASDRFRDNSPSTDGGLHRNIDMGLWPGGSTTVAVTTASIQRKSPDVQLVEPDPLQVKVEKVEGGLLGDAEMVEVPLIGEDGLVECGPRGAGGHGRPGLQKQDNPAGSNQNQNQPSACSLPEITQLSRAKHSSRGSINNRGAEKEDEEADLVLVKVEEMEGVTEESSLRIQEVESSTDDYRAVLPFEDQAGAQNPTNRLSDLQESSQSFSEVSYGHSSLWTNGGDDSYCHDNSMPGPSSHRAPLSYPPGTLLVVEPGGGSGRGLAGACSAGGGLAAEGGDGFQSASSSSASFEQAGGVIDLSDESSPVRVEEAGQTQAGPSEHFLAQRQGQSGLASGAAAKGKQKVARKRECICPFCGKGFGSPAGLESHLRTHTGERPYGCNICGKKFTQFWNLKIHRNIHTGERPYQCPLCPERFSDPSNLKKHQKRHHTDGSQT